jgi:enamine deaminase RidA (YjgF/YER057c/UK114 family)
MSKQLIGKARNSRKDASLASRRNFVSAAAAFSAVGSAKAAQAQPTQNSQLLSFKNTPGLFPPRGYSHLAEVMGPHRILYLSGQVPVDHNDKVLEGARAQFTLYSRI